MASAYPLEGRLISGSELDVWLRGAIATTQHEALLCSAYIRSVAFLRLLMSRVLGEPLRASVLVRWQAQDLVSGASDLELFEVCSKYNIELFMRLDFHGKVYAVLPYGISVGSANATASGLGFGSQPNAEMNTLVNCSDENIRIVRSQFHGATRITNRLYERMHLDLESMHRSEILSPQWSFDVLSILQPPVTPTSLLVDECFLTDGRWWSQGLGEARDTRVEHDLQLLGIDNACRSEGELQSALRHTKCVRWLTDRLMRAPQGEMYFGTLTAGLHDALLDDPGPRRSEVKTLLQNLLSWIQFASLPELSVDRPNYSQRVRLRSG